MKKILFLLTLCLYSIFVNCQTPPSYYRVDKATIINHIGNDWIDGESNYPKKMVIILSGSKIQITNTAHASYVTYGNMKTTKKITCVFYSWNAYDKESVDCLFVISYCSGDITFTALYDDWGIEYSVTKL